MAAKNKYHFERLREGKSRCMPIIFHKITPEKRLLVYRAAHRWTRHHGIKIRTESTDTKLKIWRIE